MKSFYLLLIVAALLLTGCTITFDTKKDSVDTPPYTGKALHLAVIGEAPTVREEQVRFSAITFEDLLDSQSLKADYDAVFIMKEHLSEAAEDRYAEVYRTAGIPFFFIESKKSYIPFILEDVDYEDIKDTNDGIYATGYFNSEGKWEFWGTGLYNDKVNSRNIQSAYSLVFETIHNWPLK
ncbi:hypothetical protein PAECIP111892_03698 [Paenibacillus auburnensis]|uniref:Lipoprotein n=1 Tax=Paenibacillus auburnensis TaxID=2905649 RepID=A0ABM9CGG8_9BACL|nr:hypothetical protein [Paenibacillus auburnensis]CAH1212116.1 hypothetical protein PAECIP111892_03698 [Paenibacillus auburnensis]